jgi:succinyl-diaminopimelate desuccinylase
MTRLDAAAAAAVRHVDAHRDALVEFLAELVRIRSVFPPGDYAEIAPRMQRAFAGLGARVSLVAAPREPVEAAGLAYPRPNVVAALDGRRGRPVLMIGTHMDVVGVDDPERWSADPFAGVVRGGRVWGRGACDAKCAMAAQVFAARALVESGVTLEGTLLLVCSVDDEGRFDRLKWPGMTFLAEGGLIDAGFPFPEMVINGEASGLDNICGSFKGRLILEIPVLGETAHAATPYGINAIDKAVRLIERLKAIELREHPVQGRETLNICAIEGVANRYGDIPPICRVGVEARVVPPQGTDRLRAEIDRAIAELRREDSQFHVGDVTVFSDRQPVEMPPDSPLVRAIRSAAALAGVDAEYAPILGTGELQAFVGRGIPGVTYGAGSIERVHRTDEFLEIEELVRQTKIYALTAIHACGLADA